MKRLRILLAAAAVSSVTLLIEPGCTAPKPTSDTAPNTNDEPAAKPPINDPPKHHSEWADVTGRVVWGGGEPPAREKLNVTKDQEHCLSKGALFNEKWVVNKENGGVRWAVVWLTPDSDTKTPLPIHPSLKEIDRTKKHIMDQPCCKFEPRALAMREGETLIAKNSSPIGHNFKYAGIKNPGNNVLIPPMQEVVINQPPVRTSPFAVNIECNIHGWMRAYIWVLPQPYFAVTDENGRFEIKNAPVGNWRLVVWQEEMGFRTDRNGEPIEIKAETKHDLGKFEAKPRSN